ncbi:MAG TPA: HupE/UreJ family protein, partial [Chitinophagaceae bacterium]|nr:HupE/UreJ family protein [Chitinophagaceae bacterium]
MGFANTLRVMLARDQNLGWSLFGFNLGLEVGQIVVVFILLLFAQVVVNLFRVQRRDWVLFLSSGVFALALKIALERIPVS